VRRAARSITTLVSCGRFVNQRHRFRVERVLRERDEAKTKRACQETRAGRKEMLRCREQTELVRVLA